MDQGVPHRRGSIHGKVIMCKEHDNQVYFDFLERLRESGTNMYGAPAYLEDIFGLTKKEAIEVTKAWMDSYKFLENI